MKVFKYFLVFSLLTCFSFASIVGTTKGNTSVNQGNMKFSLPIDLPKGVKDIKPSLSITYSSSSNSFGKLGVGFALNGFSNISVCNEYTQEEIKDSSRDFNYCLNGQELVRVNPNDTYGGDGVEYRTKIDGHQKIVSYAQAGKTTSWKLFTKDGFIYEYGATANSKQKDANDKVIVFRRDKVSDRFSNEINYNYDDTGYIQTITYSNNKIEFVYENAEISKFRYYKGVKNTYDRRLKTIVVKIDEEEISSYNLSYENNRLTKIENCFGNECLKPLNFTWDKKAEDETQYFKELNQTLSKNFGTKTDTFEALSGDFDGDSKTDVARYTNNQIYTLLSNGDGTFTQKLFTTPKNFGAKRDSYETLSGDFDGNGLKDIVRYTNNEIYTLLSKGDGTFTQKLFTSSKNFSSKDTVYYSTSGDFDGDGRTDILRYTKNELYTFLSKGDGTFTMVSSTTPANFGAKNDSYFLATGDYNGDGLGDFIRYTNNNIYVFLSNGDGKFTQKHITTSTNFGAKNDTYYSLSGDFNGDGQTDFVRYTNNKIYTLFSKGDGTFEEKLFTTSKSFGAKDDSYSLVSGDFDGDGLQDIVRVKNKEVFILFSKGDGTFEQKSFTTTTDFGVSENSYKALIGEFSGDGIYDFIRFNANKIYTIQALNKKEVVTTISNGVDQDTFIEYSTLNDTSIYTANSDEAYPNMDIKQSSRRVVKALNLLDGVGGKNRYTYKYEGLKLNVEYGLLGFSKVTKTNETNGDYTISTYRQDYPYIAIPKTKEQYVDDIKIVDEQNTYESLSFENEKIKSIYLAKKIVTKYDITGDFLLKVEQTQSTPDKYGNIQELTTTTFDSQDETATGFSKKIIKSFKPADENKWLVDLISSQKVIYTKPTGIENQKEQKEYYTYDTNGLLLTQKIVDEDANKELIKEYIYDTKSNVTKQSLSGTDIEKRIEHYTYDSFGKNIVEIVNPLGQIQKNIYDKKSNLIEVVDINSLHTFYEYDKLNRKIKEIKPDTTTTTWNYLWDNSFENSIYKIAVKATGAPEVTTYFDAKNRKVRVQRYGFKGDVIFEDTYYDSLGRVSKKTTPHYAYELPNFAYNTYDSLNRIIKIKSKGATGQDIEKNFVYEGFSTKEINAKNQIKQTIKNAVGQTVKVVEEQGAFIEYAYDAIGNLITTTDSQDNTVQIRYDDQGNKIYMNDPDMGEWTYKYNMLGELISQTDAKGQTTTITYDLLGRVIKRVEPEGESTFTYDIALNAIGKIAIEESSEYKKEYFYDELARLKETKEYINNKIFSTNYIYDEQGKLKTTVHPNGFVQVNEYNEQGYLSAVKSPIANDDNLSYERLKENIKENLDKKTEAFNSMIELNTQIEKYRVKALEHMNLADAYKNVDDKIEDQLLKTANLLIQTSIELKNKALVYENNYKVYEKKLNYYLVKLINFNDEQLYKWLMDTFSAKSTQNIELALQKLDEASSSLDSITTQDELDTYKEIISYYIQEAKTIITEAKTNIELARNYKEKYKNLRDGVDKAYQGMFDNSDFKYYYKILDADEFGRITKAFHGNGLETTKEYNKINGQLQRVQTGYNGSNDIRDIKYTFDVLNNVTSKNDLKQGIYQSYTFDNLNRVISATTKSESIDESVTYSYDTIGNIQNKSDLGDYTYVKAHQVETAGGISYTYDENGNVIEKTKDGKTTTITYSSYNKPIKIEDDTNTTQFFYAPNRARYKKTLNGDTTFYIGKDYEQENQGTTKLEKNYIYMADELVAIHIQEDDGVMSLPQNRYMHKDALGSIDTITNESGVVIQRLAYDTFGKKIVQEWINDSDTKPLVKRGYTGHEHIEEFELIHMNGRVYDPVSARFLSADPNIFHPFMTQNFNRYSYVMNNPLIYTDPSGFDFDDGPGAGGRQDSSSIGGNSRGDGDSNDENSSPSDKRQNRNIGERETPNNAEKEESWYNKSVKAAREMYFDNLAQAFGQDFALQARKAYIETTLYSFQGILDFLVEQDKMFRELSPKTLSKQPLDERLAFAPLVGALISLGFEGYRQYKAGKLDVLGLFVAAGTGAIGGLGKTALRSIMAGSLSNMANDAYGQLKTGKFDTGKFINSGISGILGSVTGNLGTGIGSNINKGVIGSYLGETNNYRNAGSIAGSLTGGFISNTNWGEK